MSQQEQIVESPFAIPVPDVRIAEVTNVRTLKPYMVYRSSDYDLFGYDPANRQIDWSHVNRLVISVQQHGFLPNRHIDVKRDGNRLVIMDGQHRFEAARKLNLSILFMLDPLASSDLIPHLNSTQRGWTVNDYLRLWADEHRLPAYLELKAFIKKYGFGVSVALSLALGGTGGGASPEQRHEFETGRFRYRDPAFAYHVGEMSRSRPFVIALAYLARLDGYNHDEMLAKATYQSAKLMKQADSEGYLRMLEDIYNYRRAAESRLRFA